MRSSKSLRAVSIACSASVRFLSFSLALCSSLASCAMKETHKEQYDVCLLGCFCCDPLFCVRAATLAVQTAPLHDAAIGTVSQRRASELC